VAAELLVLVHLAGVVVEAEVGEPGGGVAQEVPDDDDDGSGDGDEDAGFASAAGDEDAALAKERMGAGGAAGGLGEGVAGVAVAVALLPASVAAAGLGGLGTSPAQDTRWAVVGTRVMSRPISAMMLRARVWLMPGISASRPAASGTAAVSPVPAPGPAAPGSDPQVRSQRQAFIRAAIPQ
jgi:hypothetical protein